MRGERARRGAMRRVGRRDTLEGVKANFATNELLEDTTGEDKGRAT